MIFLLLSQFFLISMQLLHCISILNYRFPEISIRLLLTLLLLILRLLFILLYRQLQLTCTRLLYIITNKILLVKLMILNLKLKLIFIYITMMLLRISDQIILQLLNIFLSFHFNIFVGFIFCSVDCLRQLDIRLTDLQLGLVGLLVLSSTGSADPCVISFGSWDLSFN